jgi:tRNA (guanine-N7-)-methyltransferase
VDSKPVTSQQTGPHDSLDSVVLKHLHHRWRRPLPDWVQQLADDSLQQHADAPWILDSGCGTGLSTLQLARAFPEHWVIGIDQSAHRLGRISTNPPANLRYLRVDAQDFWRALHLRHIRLSRHYLLYPNPWPKAHHLMRRWHGHPVWPTLLAMGGVLELRSNWPVYVQEFGRALALSTDAAVHMDTLDNTDALQQPLTLFEKKYAASGHAIARLRCDLNQAVQSG